MDFTRDSSPQMFCFLPPYHVFLPPSVGCRRRSSFSLMRRLGAPFWVLELGPPHQPPSSCYFLLTGFFSFSVEFFPRALSRCHGGRPPFAGLISAAFSRLFQKPFAARSPPRRRPASGVSRRLLSGPKLNPFLSPLRKAFLPSNCRVQDRRTPGA